jgi:hypothetical protein
MIVLGHRPAGSGLYLRLPRDRARPTAAGRALHHSRRHTTQRIPARPRSVMTRVGLRSRDCGHSGHMAWSRRQRRNDPFGRYDDDPRRVPYGYCGEGYGYRRRPMGEVCLRDACLIDTGCCLAESWTATACYSPCSPFRRCLSGRVTASDRPEVAPRARSCAAAAPISVRSALTGPGVTASPRPAPNAGCKRYSGTAPVAD